MIISSGCATVYDSSGKPFVGKRPELRIWDLSPKTKLEDEQLHFLQQCYMAWEINTEIIEEEDFTKVEVKGFWVGLLTGIGAFFSTMFGWIGALF